ncbi:MAG TPA: site-2 protease family protein [archaeon]|nr:site-2 protease family protein [archaeon]
MVQSYYTLFEVQGIKVNLHITFIALFALLALYGALAKGPLYAASIVLFIVVLFGTVFLHELSHALVARHERIRVDSINLLPIGGIASIHATSMTPKNEFKMAIAGPLFNIFVCLLIAFLEVFTPLSVPLPPPGAAVGDIFDLFQLYPMYTLFLVNFTLAAFNLLIPAIPMDGGRVLRALLAMWLGFYRATLISARLSKILAFGLFLWGVSILSPFLPIIAFFVYMGARSEEESALIENILSRVPLSRVLEKKPFKLNSSTTVKAALSRMNAENATSVLVVARDHFRVAQIEDVVEAVKKDASRELERASVKAPHVSSKDDCAAAYKQFLAVTYDLLPVSGNGKLEGVVLRRDLETLYRLRSAEKVLKQ